jgi:GNAT superfamily N-acetyltransferase
MPDRKHDVSQQTVDVLERTRRDLEVSLVAVREDRRRRGHSAAVISALERVARAILGFDAGRDPPHHGQGRRYLRPADLGTR